MTQSTQILANSF